MAFLGIHYTSAETQQLQQLLASFSGSTTATSLVKGVSVTAFNTTANNTISMTLKHTGPENTPPVRVVASGLSISEKEIASVIKSIGPLFKALASSIGSNNTSLSNATNPVANQSILHSLKVVTGSSTINAGWKSPTTVSIQLQGNTTLGEANLINAQVIPTVRQ